jgi:hypothetical protein
MALFGNWAKGSGEAIGHDCGLGFPSGFALGYPDSQVRCSECDRLLVEYERLEGDYATSIQTLGARRDTAIASEYIRLRTAADEARIDCEVARLALEQHKRIHTKAN